MRATECPFYTACRRQQNTNAELRAKGQPAAPCHAEKVGCNDQSNNMEERCRLFTNLLVRLEVARSEREQEYLEVAGASDGIKKG